MINAFIVNMQLGLQHRPPLNAGQQTSPVAPVRGSSRRGRGRPPGSRGRPPTARGSARGRSQVDSGEDKGVGRERRGRGRPPSCRKRQGSTDDGSSGTKRAKRDTSKSSSVVSPSRGSSRSGRRIGRPFTARGSSRSRCRRSQASSSDAATSNSQEPLNAALARGSSRRGRGRGRGRPPLNAGQQTSPVAPVRGSSRRGRGRPPGSRGRPPTARGSARGSARGRSQVDSGEDKGVANLGTAGVSDVQAPLGGSVEGPEAVEHPAIEEASHGQQAPLEAMGDGHEGSPDYDSLDPLTFKDIGLKSNEPLLPDQ
ncbi:AT hook DNA-binding motif-containing protein [Dioscorea alata]|uniref:AT hook DNA-binding motif-containing protein n=1 Tax=Dioscorea alata TaxID=55571 RepID=A0ACB7UM76_DIOAL|nr:AT hook DNA-binding motif-containing protein [Dioscorea alata]